MRSGGKVDPSQILWLSMVGDLNRLVTDIYVKLILISLALYLVMFRYLHVDHNTVHICSLSFVHFIHFILSFRISFHVHPVIVLGSD